METATKQNPVVRFKNFVVRNERKIVYPALAATTAGTVLMFRNQHVINEFLKEHGLYEQFYALATEA